MKRALPLFCIAVIAIATPSFAADPFCQELNKILAGFDSGFSSLRGALKKEGVEMWFATQAIPGGSDCLVTGAKDTSYVCTLYEGDDDQTARDTYEDVVQRVGTCLGTSWKGRELVDAERTEHTFKPTKGNPIVRIRAGIGGGNASTVEFRIDPAGSTP